MYTLIIQNSKTMDSFYEHLPLFNRILNDQSLGLCTWNEGGQTLEEALPDLHRLTDDKIRWRAVIVRYEDEKAMAACPASIENPYDFLANTKEYDEAAAMENPLLRLTRLLEPPLEYFRPGRARQNGFQSLRYDGVLPDTITLISVRNTDELFLVPSKMRTLYQKEFAMRNGYPSCCRFVVVDRASQGPFRKMEDDFNFWNTVLAVAHNPQTTAFMEAYSLYAGGCEFDAKQLETIWNHKSDSLLRLAAEMRHRLEYQSLYLETYEGPYPDYETSVHIPPSYENSLYRKADPDIYAAAKEDSEELLEHWRKESTAIKDDLLLREQKIPDDLQKTISSLRYRNGYPSEEVDILSGFQTERLQEELHTLYLRIIEEQSSLPRLKFEKGDSLDQAGLAVETQIRRLVRKETVMKAVLYLSLVMVVGFISVGLILLKHYDFTWIWALPFVIILIVLPFVFSKSILREQTRQIRRVIQIWNQEAENKSKILWELVESYAKYLSDSVSYRRGKSYLDLSKKKKQEEKERLKDVEKRIELTQAFEKKLREWGKALGIRMTVPVIKADDFGSKPLDLDSREPQTDLSIDNDFLFLEEDYDQLTELNETGRKIAFPGSYVRRLRLEPFSKGESQS